MFKPVSVLSIKQSLKRLAKPCVLTFILLMAMPGINAAEAEVAVDLILEAAKIHTPGKVVAHEKADEQVSEAGSQVGAKALQPVYRVKILSKQGVMKTVLVHRQTGQVVE